MRLEMISTGEEVLSGQIVDTNAAWFSDSLLSLGIELQRRTTVGDRLDDLVDLFRERSRHADLILINGGLGPTSDDLSVEAAARALDQPLVENAAWRRHLEAWFEERGRPMPESNLKQCLLPRSAILIDNPSGSAPGFRIRLNDAWLFFTPGVPSEFKCMVEQQFIPFMQSEFNVGEPTQLRKLLTLGHGESSLADLLDRLDPPPGITLGYRPSVPHVEVKVFARGEKAISMLPQFTQRVRETLGSAVVSEGAPSIAEEVHELLLRQEATLTLAESCTGGMLTSLLVECPGSSSYLLEGVVTYSNAAKMRTLAVSAATLDAHGAVSIPTAREMAQGVRRPLDTDFALSTTGIAGPTGGSEEKPVGTVCIGLADRQNTWVQRVLLSNRSRKTVKVMSCALALDMLRRRMRGENPIADYPFIRRIDQQVFAEDAGPPASPIDTTPDD